MINLDISSWLLFALLIVMGVWWINLFNFMDGIDGLAGTQSIFMLMSAAALAWMMQPAAIGNPAWVWMIFTAAATLGFLWLNWPPAKIFMGDVGSTWLAFILFAFALLSIQAGWLSYTSWLILSAIFVTDATLTLLVRILRGDRWYQAHKSHAYQRLSRLWKNNRKKGHQIVTLIVIAINILWLLPLSAASLMMPTYSWLWLLLAYTPIAICTLRIGAGRSEHA
jgi:Fuc2NAc and GlcNAc transferase